MPIIGLLAEIAVLGCSVGAIITNIIFLTHCEFFVLERGFRDVGSLGLYHANIPDNPDEGCMKIEDTGLVVDAAFNCAKVCGALAVVFGCIVVVFGFMKQCLFQLPCTQPIMDLSGVCIQLFLALVYVIYLTDTCSNFECDPGEGLICLIVTQVFWIVASCLSRCMRPGRRERARDASNNPPSPASTPADK
jgi:hypothetical protein